MLAEIISIGDELTSGQRLDTNSQWLSERLGELGIRVGFHTTVADDLAANILVFQQAVQRADLIISTGGLGPTADDLTREAIASMSGVPLVLYPQALEHIEQLFARRKRPMPPANRQQALFPEGSAIVHNPHGSAPGIDMLVPREGRSPSRIFALPGVPAEMREMWDGTLVNAISDMLPEKTILHHHRIKCFGVGESDLEAMLPDLIRRGRDPIVGITVSKATITLRITASAPTVDQARQKMEPTIQTIEQSLGQLIFGREEDELQHAVLAHLQKRQQTVAVVEWGTGGLVGNWLSEVPQVNRSYIGGLTINSTSVANSLLGVAWPQQSDNPAELESLIVTMASRWREQTGADYGLAMGPFPAVNLGQQESGSVVMGLASVSTAVTHAFPLAGHPDIVRARAGKQLLNMLRLHLLRNEL